MTTFLTTLIIPLLLLILLACAGFASSANGQDATIEHVMVYQQEGRFGGWPANHGIRSWGNEIVVGFSAGYHKDRGPALHTLKAGLPTCRYIPGSAEQPRGPMKPMDLFRRAVAEIGDASAAELSAHLANRHGFKIAPAFIPLYKATLQDLERTAGLRQQQGPHP